MHKFLRPLIILILSVLILEGSEIRNGKEHSNIKYSNFTVTLTKDLMTGERNAWITTKTKKQNNSNMYLTLQRYSDGILIKGYASLIDQKSPLKIKFDDNKILSINIKKVGQYGTFKKSKFVYEKGGDIFIIKNDALQLDNLMKKSDTLTVDVMAKGKKRYVLKFPLKGYSKAYQKYISWINNK